MVGAALKVKVAPGANHCKVVDGVILVVIIWEGQFRRNVLVGAVSAALDIVALLLEGYYHTKSTITTTSSSNDIIIPCMVRRGICGIVSTWG